MAYDGFVNYTISKELSPCIIGGKIDSIFEPNNNEIIIGIYNNSSKYALDIVTSSNNYRVCLTQNKKVNPTFAPNFCMVLRKHLLNTRITNLYTLSLERIMIIEFEGHSKSENIGKKKIIIELMGKHSNIILVDSCDVIIDALKHFNNDENSYRSIFSGSKYTLPLSSKHDFINLQDEKNFYEDFLNYSKEYNTEKLTDILSNLYTGFSKTLISCLLEKISIEDFLSENNTDLVYSYLRKLLNNTTDTIATCYNEKDYSVFLFQKDNPLQVNFFIDNFYYSKEKNENFKNIKNNFSNEVLAYFKKLNTRLTNINSRLKECQNADLYKLYGELITNNLYRISNNHIESLTIENYYDNNNLITIPLDKSILPSANAKKYFKKYSKLKNAKKITELQKEEVQEELSYLESIIYEFEVATTTQEIEDIRNEFHETFLTDKNLSIKKNKKNQKNTKKNNLHIEKIGEPLKFTIDNYTVIVGKNNRQNDFITKQANPTDIWFHTKDVHGSHVILKVNNKLPAQDTINKVASIAAFYSQASKSSNVPVDYTLIKNVKKPSKSKPGMVIYTNNKNVIVHPIIPSK